MVNVNKLQEALRARDVSTETAAKALGIDRATFYRRLSRNGSKFTVEEVAKLIQLLHLSSESVQEIFFDRELA